MNPNNLIEKWYRHFISAATRWAKHDSDKAEREAVAYMDCILDLAMESGYPDRSELSSELWAVLERR